MEKPLWREGMQDALGMQAVSRDPGRITAHGLAPNRGVHYTSGDSWGETQASSCHLSKDTPPQLLTGPSLTMRYGGQRPKIDLLECVRAGSCPVLAFQAAVRFREEIRALRGVFILDIVLHCIVLFCFIMWNETLNWSITQLNMIGVLYPANNHLDFTETLLTPLREWIMFSLFT